MKFDMDISDEINEFFEDMKNKYTEEEIKAFLLFPYLYNEDISIGKMTELLKIPFLSLGKIYKKYYMPTNSDDYKEKFI